MQKLTGNLKTLGNATIRNNETHYSLIEIGGQVVQKVSARSDIDTFLNKGLTNPGDITLWLLKGNILVCVELSDGKRYVRKNFTVGPTGVALISIFFAPLFGAGIVAGMIYFLGSGYTEHKEFNLLIAEKPDAVILS